MTDRKLMKGNEALALAAIRTSFDILKVHSTPSSAWLAGLLADVGAGGYVQLCSTAALGRRAAEHSARSPPAAALRLPCCLCSQLPAAPRPCLRPPSPVRPQMPDPTQEALDLMRAFNAQKVAEAGGAPPMAGSVDEMSLYQVLTCNGSGLVLVYQDVDPLTSGLADDEVSLRGAPLGGPRAAPRRAALRCASGPAQARQRPPRLPGGRTAPAPRRQR